jgi:hypothetical protein
MSAANDKSIEIHFPEDIIEIVEEWASSIDHGVGVCLLCGSVIHTEAEFIPGTSIHNCAAGRSLEQPEPHS